MKSRLARTKNILNLKLSIAPSNSGAIAIKKDQTNKNILITTLSSFDSSFNSVQSLNASLPYFKEDNININNYKKLDSAGEGVVSLRNPRTRQRRSCPSLTTASNKRELQQPQLQLLRTNGSISKSSALLNLVRFLKGEILIPNILTKEILTRSNFLKNKFRSILSTESSNLLMRNRNYQNLKSNLSTLLGEGSFYLYLDKNKEEGLKKRIQTNSDAGLLEDKPTKNYILFQYLNSFLFDGRIKTKISLNKYKGFRVHSCETTGRRKNESILNYNKIIGYNFNSTFYPSLGCPSTKAVFRQEQVNSSNINIKDTYKLLFYLFKSMYCLISKPVLKYTNDKVIIQLFYYLNIPKKKVFRLFYNSLRSEGTAAVVFRQQQPLQEKGNLLWSLNPKGQLSGTANGNPSELSNSKINIRWSTGLRKAISRFKIKNNKKLLFNLRKFNLTAKSVFQHKFKLICDILSNKFNKPVELQLTRLHHPYHDSNILVNLLSLNFKNKKKRARVAINKIYSKKNLLLKDAKIVSFGDNNCEAFANSTSNTSNGSSNSYPASPQNLYFYPLNKDKKEVASQNLLGSQGITGVAPLIPGPLLSKEDKKNLNNLNSVKFIPAFLSGLNIKIAGRLMGEPIIPRITTKVFEKGATATGKVNYLDVARITKKNRKGAYTIKITSGQNFF